MRIGLKIKNDGEESFFPANLHWLNCAVEILALEIDRIIEIILRLFLHREI
jgi:hypothetical protein